MGVKELNEVTIKNYKESRYIVSIMFLLSLYSFFGYLLPSSASYFTLVTLIIALIFYLIIERNIIISYNQLFIIFIIIIFMLIQLLLAGYSIFPVSSMKVAINKSAIMVIGALFYIHKNWYKNGIRIMFIFSCVHTAFTIISYLLPLSFNNIIMPIIPEHIATTISQFMSRDVYPGITNQTGRNAFYISIGIAILFCIFTTHNIKYNRIKYISFALFLLALLLTGKRGHLVANIISMLFVSGFYAKSKGNSSFLKLFKVAILLCFISFVLIFLFPEAAVPFLRFFLKRGGDQTSGRIYLYINAIRLFEQKPILGWGTGVFSNLFGIGVHNIYLQLLSENGLIGFVLISLILLINLVHTLKAIRLTLINGQSNSIKYLLFSLYIQVFFMTYGLTGNPFNDGFILIIYFVASSISYTLKEPEKYKCL